MKDDRWFTLTLLYAAAQAAVGGEVSEPAETVMAGDGPVPVVVEPAASTPDLV